MSKMIRVDKCDKCPYVRSVGEYWPDPMCLHEKVIWDKIIIPDIMSIPEWCPLEEIK